MNEIERAIKEIEKAIDPRRCISLLDGTRFSKEWISVNSLNLARMLLRAELTRRENAPLTCEGCEWEYKVTVVARCQRCKRCPMLSDRYKPKGEATT